jgi:hypothetical protein
MFDSIPDLNPLSWLVGYTIHSDILPINHLPRKVTSLMPNFLVIADNPKDDKMCGFKKLFAVICRLPLKYILLKCVKSKESVALVLGVLQ